MFITRIISASMPRLLPEAAHPLRLRLAMGYPSVAVGIGSEDGWRNTRTPLMWQRWMPGSRASVAGGAWG